MSVVAETRHYRKIPYAATRSRSSSVMVFGTIAMMRKEVGEQLGPVGHFQRQRREGPKIARDGGLPDHLPAAFALFLAAGHKSPVSPPRPGAKGCDRVGATGTGWSLAARRCFNHLCTASVTA